ncbi:hypothetical protein CFOL_v3_03487 [Cephalotus follicularis]|uniref:Uncharacterized protein n=1 Tax=Cephalotus follicularis TaxID=3775 RepID=A0A1Q3AW19_CEPFO|nr:hypothetical protein CFOL_v3_03487 [Cephalotus follicularis]
MCHQLSNSIHTHKHKHNPNTEPNKSWCHRAVLASIRCLLLNGRMANCLRWLIFFFWWGKLPEAFPQTLDGRLRNASSARGRARLGGPRETVPAGSNEQSIP